MTDLKISLSHQPDLMHHVRQAKAWLLSAAGAGENTAALSYAALELRFAVERLAVHYWAQLLGNKLGPKSMREIESFKGIEASIRKLAGHQRQVDRHFELIRLMMRELGIDTPLVTANIGQLKRFWQVCSEMCHIAFPLLCSVAEVREQAVKNLHEIAESMTTYAEAAGWPQLGDNAQFYELHRNYLSGKVEAELVLESLRKAGLWASYEEPGKPPQFIGKAVPPES
jgi:hypothetical protein